MSQQVLARLSRAYSRPDKAPGGTPVPGVQEHRLAQALLWEVPSQAVPAAVREQATPLSVGAGTLHCTPVACAT